MRKLGKTFWLSMIVLILVTGFYFYGRRTPLLTYDLVIYGGGFAGCASAYSAATVAPEQKILLIVTDPVPFLGGLGTVGGQNFADIRYWQGDLVTQGSWQRWFAKGEQFYNTAEMAQKLAEELGQFANLTILYQYDLQKVKTKKVSGGDNLLRSLTLVPLYRDEQNFIWQDKGKIKVVGEVFIDASDSGQLTQLAGNLLAVGRQDWPAEYLSTAEREEGQGRQQAATLMFKVSGVKTPEKPGVIGDLNFVQDLHHCWAIVGGAETWANNSLVRQFNEQYGPQGFALKPLNAAQNGAGSAEWWLNMLLVFDVEGQMGKKDGEVRTAERAWREAREVLQKPEFREALRAFAVGEGEERYGFEAADLVWDAEGKPVVGAIMYLRETVHLWARNKEGAEFALTTKAVQQAGSNADEGGDQENFATRIGLGYYLMDINAFRDIDLLLEGNYVWPVTGNLRPDWQECGGQPQNPVYLPWAMLQANKSRNLLVPGYATGCSSLAWAAIRVLPNLTVLGDAAGVAAAGAFLFGESPADFGEIHLQWVQEKLRQMGARLDK